MGNSVMLLLWDVYQCDVVKLGCVTVCCCFCKMCNSDVVIVGCETEFVTV